MNAASPPRRASSRIDIPHDGESLAGEDESGCAGPELRVRDVLEDSPATAALLKQACSAAEAAGTLVQKALRRAAVLRETLRVAGTQRAELVQALRALEAVYASSDDAAAVLSGGFRAVVDSIEDVNRVMALDEYHLASIVIEPLQSLAEQPTVVRNAFKNVTKLRSAMESLADKVAATDRKEATANAKDLQKQDEVKQEFSEGVGRYRKALLDYSMTVTRMQTERKHRMLRQLLAFWLSQRAQVKSMEQMQGDVEPFIRTTVAHLDGAPCGVRCIAALGNARSLWLVSFLQRWSCAPKRSIPRRWRSGARSRRRRISSTATWMATRWRAPTWPAEGGCGAAEQANWACGHDVISALPAANCSSWVQRLSRFRS